MPKNKISRIGNPKNRGYVELGTHERTKKILNETRRHLERKCAECRDLRKRLDYEREV